MKSALTWSVCRGESFSLPKIPSSSSASSPAKTCLGTPQHPERNPKLRDDISTDEITPAHICFFFDETLGEFPYTGLKCGNETPIKRGDVKRGGFVCAVSGKRRGKGSSREQSPYAEMSAGIKLVIAENIERIYKQNCQNLGVLTSTDFGMIDKIRGGEEIPLVEFTEGEDEITRQVIEYGGLFPFNVARMQGKVFLPPITTKPRPDDHRREDFRAPHGARRQPSRRRGGEARRHRIRAHRSALQPRIRHADGGDLLRAFSRQGRAGNRRRAPSCSSATTSPSSTRCCRKRSARWGCSTWRRS